MQNNSQGRCDRVDPKVAPIHDEPSSRGLRAKTHPVDEATPTEVMKSFAAGVVTNCLRLNIRKEANSDAEVLAIIDALSEVIVDMDTSSGEFYKVCTAAGIEGFCMKKYIALRR